MTALCFGFFQADVTNSTLPIYRTLICYFALFLLAGVFTLCITFDALWNRNIITLVGMLIFTAPLCFPPGTEVREVQLTQNNDCQSKNVATCMDLFNIVERFLIVVPVIILLALVVKSWCMKHLFGEFGWAVFHTIGADPRIKHMYRFYQAFLCLLKFDYFILLAVSLQLLILGLGGDPIQDLILIASIPVSLALLIGCGWAVKKENRIVMIICLVIMAAALGYILYKTTQFYIGRYVSDYVPNRLTLTFFTVVSMLMLSATFCIGIRCMLFFGCGLKEAQGAASERARRAKPMRRASYREPDEEEFIGDSDEKKGGALPLERRLSID
ncbi:hypothetical protein DACRYDRAFT_16741 [Dacryopinax primogenitus]|uniref:Uncharacterized protein n=1 Tax=Dacryopinax primogenitus (strain DJM 731) TaxID=1858805 RepID=M5FT99_DACPD|nr:uncharacterized protein DACRYDRAFT_16741 [Dacryopinax primogenitus]EJU00836.1 hypothetical protein DACRYDRAFT_16741 [Dacryopinax primogenitus]